MEKSLTPTLQNTDNLETIKTTIEKSYTIEQAAAMNPLALAYIGDGQNRRNLLEDIKLSFKADVPSKALDTFLISRKKSAMLALFEDDSDYKPEEIAAAAKEQAQASVHALKEQGILVEKDGKLNTQIVYTNGEIQVNGKTLDADGTAVLMSEAL